MMFYDNPKLWPAFVYGLVFAAGWVMVETEAPGAWGVLGGVLTLLGLLLGSLTVLMYIGGWMTYFLEILITARAVTKASKLADSMRGLTAEQTRLVEQQIPALGIKMTAMGPRVLVNGTTVPISFIRDEYIPRCTIKEGTTYTAPIGSWAEGKTYPGYGECRELARQFTQLLVTLDLAVWGSGNQSARLLEGRTTFDLMRMLGLNEMMGAPNA